jgi:hypothetical protein
VLTYASYVVKFLWLKYRSGNSRDGDRRRPTKNGVQGRWPRRKEVSAFFEVSRDEIVLG